MIPTWIDTIFYLCYNVYEIGPKRVMYGGNDYVLQELWRTDE